MPTLFDTPTALPFPGSLSDLQSQWLEASTRALTASADLYTEVLRSQADAATGLVEAYLAVGRQSTTTRYRPKTTMYFSDGLIRRPPTTSTRPTTTPPSSVAGTLPKPPSATAT